MNSGGIVCEGTSRTIFWGFKIISELPVLICKWGLFILFKDTEGEIYFNNGNKMIISKVIDEHRRGFSYSGTQCHPIFYFFFSE